MLATLHQSAYRIAYRLARLWWFLRRPSSRGVMCAIWYEDKLLCLQSSYRPLLTLPGGFVDRGESPHQAAQRELQEELQLKLDIPPQAVWHKTLDFEHRRDEVWIFERHLPEMQVFHIKAGEILHAQYYSVSELNHQPLMPHLADYLRQKSQHPRT